MKQNDEDLSELEILVQVAQKKYLSQNGFNYIFLNS